MVPVVLYELPFMYREPPDFTVDPLLIEFVSTQFAHLKVALVARSESILISDGVLDLTNPAACHYSLPGIINSKFLRVGKRIEFAVISKKTPN